MTEPAPGWCIPGTCRAWTNCEGIKSAHEPRRVRGLVLTSAPSRVRVKGTVMYPCPWTRVAVVSTAAPSVSFMLVVWVGFSGRRETGVDESPESSNSEVEMVVAFLSVKRRAQHQPLSSKRRRRTRGHLPGTAISTSARLSLPRGGCCTGVGLLLGPKVMLPKYALRWSKVYLRQVPKHGS